MDVLNRYRDNNSSSDSDSDDSEKECNVWKRATSAVKRPVEEENLQNIETKEINESNESTKPKRKRNTIWTEILQDQLISEDLEDCLLKNKPAHYDSRGKESYDYTLKYEDPRIFKDVDSSMEEEYSDEKRNSSLLLQDKPKIKKFVKLNDAEYSAAKKIIKVLNEKKVYLIQRIVKFVGIEKAMSLLSMTEQIEEEGGMMINNNARRRTPGGVYLQLLKSDKDVTQEMLDKIFEGEMSCIELKKYYAERKKKMKQFRKQRKGKVNKEKREFKDILFCDFTMDTEENSRISKPQTSIAEKDTAPVVPVPTDSISDLEEGEIED